MKPHAIEQAQERVEMAQKHYDALLQGLSYKEFRPIWTEFLLAINAAFSKLEQGAKGCGSSEGWYGRHKHTRRKDPLLSYLHQARNSDEHGISPVSRATPGGVAINPPEGSDRIDHVSIDDDGVVAVRANSDGKMPLIEIRIGRIHLVEVYNDKFNDRFPVPNEHLGKPIEQVHDLGGEVGPLEVGAPGLTYVRKMLEEAQKLPSH